jgi:uncharacterized protein YbjT (DUF2867 family)
MIVITTPTGQIGRQVLGNLLNSGEKLRVIALDPAQLPAGVREDLDIVEGSHGDPAVVDKAFAGADAVLWLTPADPRAPSVEAAFAGFTRPAAEVPLLGPEDLSFNDMAEIMSQVLGKDVRFQQITFEAYKDRFVRLGMSDAMAQGYTDMAWAKNEGLDNGVQRTPENSTPTSFRQWCEQVLKPAVAA